jgi:hypothetical protein
VPKNKKSMVHNWLSGPEPMSYLISRPRIRAARLGAVLLAGVLAPLCVLRAEETPAGEFLRQVVAGELKAQAEDHSHWAYKVKAEVSGRPETKMVIETPQGNLEQLQSVGGRPIPEKQAKREHERIRRLVGNREAQRKLERAQAEDDQRTEHLFRVLPEAVLASYGARQTVLVEVLFKPNPNFHPSSHEDAVFHAMEGRLWIKGDRLAEIEGHLIRPVKFGGGLLGHLDQGGEFRIQQSEVEPGHWEITLLHVDMHGKALFFKTIGVQQNEVHYDFERVPNNLTLAEAAARLEKQTTGKAAREKGRWSAMAHPPESIGEIGTKPGYGDTPDRP